MNHSSNLQRQQTVFECLSNTCKCSSVTALDNKTPKRVAFISKKPKDLKGFAFSSQMFNERKRFRLEIINVFSV